MTAVVNILLSIITSRLGQIALAFVVAWTWSGFRTNSAWESRVAAEKAVAEAAYRAEVARQEEAAREIAVAATKRVEEDAALADELRRQIKDAEASEKTHETVRIVKGQTRVIAVPCGVDRDLVDRLHKLDAAARKGAATRPAGDLR